MAEYISRAYALEVIRHISEDEPWQEACVNNVIRLLNELPSIDIVTCKDCKYWKHIEGCSFCGNQWGLYKETAENDYCVRGEEQEDG